MILMRLANLKTMFVSVSICLLYQSQEDLLSRCSDKMTWWKNTFFSPLQKTANVPAQPPLPEGSLDKATHECD